MLHLKILHQYHCMISYLGFLVIQFFDMIGFDMISFEIKNINKMVMIFII